LFPAAATITASLSTAAYRSAAPNSACSTVLPAGRQVTAETLMTRAPRSAARTMARANTATSSAARAVTGSSPALRGANRADVERMEITRAPGATPEKPSLPGWPAIRPATRVPWPSQSVSPSPVSTKSPPASTFGSRGPGRTPVSMTATVCPSPRPYRHAPDRLSAN
jgi:hypothetical protein